MFRSGQKPPLEDWNSGQGKTHTSNTEKKTFHFNLLTALKSLFSRERIMFALISGGVFLACNAVSFYFYGHEFLHEALLYHLTRTDPRHNFSIYFYHIYLHYERQFSAVEKLISFLPQFTIQFALVFCFYQDLVFCIFLQTVAFVAFNKFGNIFKEIIHISSKTTTKDGEVVRQIAKLNDLLAQQADLMQKLNYS